MFYCFEAKNSLKRLEFGEKHGLALTEQGKIYAWGDGTYGELGDSSIQLSETPRKISFFHNQGIKVKTMSCGIRHSVVIDTEGKIYTFGDNSNSQCGLKIPWSEIPRKHETTFKSVAVFSGQTHNYVKSDQDVLYHWGGESYLRLLHDEFDDSHFKYMDIFKGKSIWNVACAYDSAVIVTHQKIFVKKADEDKE